MNLAPPGGTKELPGEIPDLSPDFSQNDQANMTPSIQRTGTRGRRPRSILDISDLQQSTRSPRRPTELAQGPMMQPNQMPIRVRSPSPQRSSGTGRSPSPLRNPFNFESVPVSASPVRPNQRRGHRYKHSSVSINFFQEPEVRNPLAIPVSHEIPTLRESWQSTTRAQVFNLCYVILRIILVWALFTGPHTTHSTSALAHLVAYDVVAHVIVVAVDILGNFEVWKQSSLRLPFALQRSEVLIGFALAITLVFFGFDIFSHVIQDVAAKIAGEDGEHHAHHHGRPDSHGAASPNSTTMAFALCLINTLTVVARLAQLENPWAENAIGCVTAVYCIVVIALPYLGGLSSGIDTVLTPLMSLSMVYFGWQVSKYFGGMLVMSHVGPDNTAALEDAIGGIPHVASVSDISIWQVHHDLWLANVKIVMSGTDENETQVRQQAEEKMRAILAQDGSTRVETTVDISRTTLD